jgi:hypothetical protein
MMHVASSSRNRMPARKPKIRTVLERALSGMAGLSLGVPDRISAPGKMPLAAGLGPGTGKAAVSISDSSGKCQVKTK